MSESRIQRAHRQRLYLIHYELNKESKDQFLKCEVVGSTGNLYNVTIGEHPNCTCPDAKRGHRCKHILFILLKFLGYDESLVDKGQPLEHFILQSCIPNLKRIAISTDIWKQVHNVEQQNQKKVIEITSDYNCAVCLESFSDTNEEKTTCDTCGNHLHKICWESWCKKGQKTCVYCRTPISSTAALSKNNNWTSGPYKNVASILKKHNLT